MKKNGAAKTVSVMIVAMMLSKILGMLRTVLLAANYGTGAEATAFSVAQRIPLSFFDILFGSAIAGCFVPIYNSFKKADDSTELDTERADRFSSIYLNFLLLVCTALAALGVIFANPIVHLIGGDLEPETFALAVTLLRIMLPLIVFAGACYTLIGVLQSRNEFVVPAFVSAFSNAFIILYYIFLNKYFGIKGLATACLCSWVIQLLSLVIPLIRRKYKYSFTLAFRDKDFKKALKNTPLAMMGSWLAPFSLLIGLSFAAKISDSVVTPFDYATNLFTIVAGILTYGICNYIFPSLARLNGKESEFAETSFSALLSALMLVFPISAALAVVSKNACAVVYMRGELSPENCAVINNIFVMLIPAIMLYAIIEVLTRVFYASGKTKIPVFAALIGIAVNAGSSYLLISVLGKGEQALGACFALGLAAAGAFLIITAAVTIRGVFTKAHLFTLVKALFCAAACYCTMRLLYVIMPNDAYSLGFFKNLVIGGSVSLVGIAVYIVLIKITGVLKANSLKAN